MLTFLKGGLFHGGKVDLDDAQGAEVVSFRAIAAAMSHQQMTVIGEEQGGIGISAVGIVAENV